jgi:hypothetical protein
MRQQINMATAKRKDNKLQEVSDTTIDYKETPTQDELTPDGLKKDSPEAIILNNQRNFLALEAKPSFTSAANARRKYDQEWIARNLFWRGYQFSRYLPQQQTVVLSSRQNARVPINLTAAYMRAIRNQVTSFRPKFEVLPTSPNSQSSQVQARYAGRLLDYYFDHLKLKMKIKETVTQGLLYSIGGPWQIVFDEIKKEINIWLLDPLDFYIDPLAEDPDDAEYQIKAVRRPLAEVTHNPQYNYFARKEVAAGDSKLAASEYKQFMIQALKQVSPRIGEESPMVILYEGFFKRRRDTGEVYMVHCIWTDQNFTPLLYEELDTDEYDFVIYRADLNPKEIYGEGWIKHVMPINRVLNSLESSAFEYNYRVAKGRIVVDRDAGVRAMHNVHGEIISKNRGSEVKALDMPSLSNSVPQQIERTWRYLEDTSGIHEASLGRIPTGVKTGIGIAELKQADATSQDDLVDNLEDFMTEVAFKMLKKIAQNYDSFKVVKDLGVREGDQKYFVAIGSQFAKNKLKNRANESKNGSKQVKIGADWFDVAEIGDDNAIRVTVGSWLGYTKEALQQKVIQYYQLQLIDQKTALRLLEFGDIDSIVEQTRLESILKKPPVVGPDGQPQPDQMQLAMTENEMMVLEGKEVPVSELDDHAVHYAIHQEALGQGQDEIVGQHLMKHAVMMGKNIQSPTPPQSPMAGSAPQPGPMAQAQPITEPVNANPIQSPQMPSVPGTPPGQNLPQQNLQAVMAQNAQTVG